MGMMHPITHFSIPVPIQPTHPPSFFPNLFHSPLDLGSRMTSIHLLSHFPRLIRYSGDLTPPNMYKLPTTRHTLTIYDSQYKIQF